MLLRLQGKHGVLEMVGVRCSYVNDVYLWILHQPKVTIVDKTCRRSIDSFGKTFGRGLGAGRGDPDEIMGHVSYSSAKRVDEKIPSKFWSLQ